MTLFGKAPKTPKAKLPQLPAPVEDTSGHESVRLINGEYTPRVNVPAIALGMGAKRTNLSLPSTSIQTRPYETSTERRLIVGRGISLGGEIAECDQLVVEGTIEATLGHGKQLYISETGLFRGNANVDEAEIAGHYEGELNVTRLRLRATAQFKGRVRFSQLEVEAGAQITGEFQYIAPAGGHQENTTIINFPPYQTAMRA